MSNNNANLTHCPTCNAQLPGLVARDGGSWLCDNCGIFHICKDGTIAFGSPGPSLCSKCRPTLAPASSSGWGRTSQFSRRESSVICDGCDADLLAPPHLRYKCRTCPNFDFCEECVVNKQHNNTHTFERIHNQAPPDPLEMTSR